MKIVNRLIVAVLALLSIAAGLAKVMQTQQEMEFLQGLGLSSFLIVVFGLVQIVGGILMAPKKIRIPGAILVTLALVVSTILVFMGGNLALGFFSVIPIALACVIIYQIARITHTKSLNTDASDAGFTGCMRGGNWHDW